MRKSFQNSKIRWGLMTTGRISGVFASAISRSRTGVLVAVAGRQKRKAEAFAKKFSIPRSYDDYFSLLRDPQVDVVYIAPPHSLHALWTIRALEAGKHVLCEKPLTAHYRDALRVIQTAKIKKRFLMEAFMYRAHPLIPKVLELIRRKVIGEVRLIQASFCFEAQRVLKNRLFNPELAGGGILDVGCYPVSIARLIAGAALGKPFADPLEVKGLGIVGKKSRVDEMALGTLQFPRGILAEVSCSIRLNRGPSLVRIDGSKGSMIFPAPWHQAYRSPRNSYINVIDNSKGRKQKIMIRCSQNLYTLEGDLVAQCLHEGRKESQAMSWKDSLGNMRTLDLWRKSIHDSSAGFK